eukprot:12926326-Prorocentrum_lima.AAC.1
MPGSKYNDLAAEVRRLKHRIQGTCAGRVAEREDELQWRDDANKAALCGHKRYVEDSGYDPPPHYAG